MAKNTKTTQIGLDAGQSSVLAEKLNILLANYQLFYINARGFHWNIKGDKFFVLHIKFEELYNNALIKIDEIAERIVTLGFVPIHSFSGYLEVAQIKEVKNVSDGDTAIKHIISSFQVLLEGERELLELTDEAGDEGTHALMSDYIREQEKLVWMYSAYLK